MTEDEQRARYERMVEDESRKPMKYFKHDFDAHQSVELTTLRYEHGMGAYGRYWLLVEHLAGRRDHAYDVSTDAGRRAMAHDMECSVAELMDFLGVLDGLGLIVHDLYAERGRVYIDRLSRNAHESAAYIARRKEAGRRAAEARWKKG